MVSKVAIRVIAYLWRKLENIGLHATQNVGLDYGVELLHIGVVQISEALFEVVQIPAGQWTLQLAWHLKLASSRKLSRLNNSRRLLFNGVPVNRIRWTELRVFSCLKIFEESDFTAPSVTAWNPLLTSLAFINDQHLPSRDAFDDLEV